MEQHDFEQHAPLWRTQALSVSRACGADADDANDVAQDVLLKLWLMRSALDQYRSPEALVTVMARNLTIDRRRRATSVVPASATLPLPDEAADPAQRLIDAEQEQRLMRMVDELPTRQHAVLVMRQVERRSYAEIGALLGIGESSAKVLLSRARKTLLQQIKDGDYNLK